MKKYVYTFLCFIFIMLVSSFKVSAKEYNDENIYVEFGNKNTLNMAYSSYDEYSIEEDKFYYDGVLYTLTQNDKDNGYVIINGEKLTINGNSLKGEKQHEFYALPIKLTIKTDKVYKFSQEVCFKYDTISNCLIDKGDEVNVTKNNYMHTFYYGFLPFYDENINFEYIYFNFKFVNVSDDKDVIEVNNFGFNVTNGDIIDYKDYFDFSLYDFGDNETYNGKDYIHPMCFELMDFSFASVILGQKECQNELWFSFFIESYSNAVDFRNYELDFRIYTGENYNDEYIVNKDDVFVIKSNDSYNYIEAFDDTLNTNEGYLFYTPLSNIDYSLSENKLEHTSFKFRVSFTCVSDCEDERKMNQIIEKTYHLDVDNPKNISSIVEGSKLPNFTTFVSNDKVIFKAEFYDHNEIEEVGYFISNNYDETDLLNKTYTPIDNGTNITVDLGEGEYYVYFKVKTKSTSKYETYRQQVIIDKSAPEMVTNNFNEYKENSAYKEVTINITYGDAAFENPTYGFVSTGYYKVIKDSEKESITIQDIIDSNTYNGSVKINKNNVNEDGKYLVCFVLKDYLNNYSDMICSNSYYLDVTALSKDEVSATEITTYQKEIKTIVTISGLSDGVSFRCALSKGVITSESELTNNCYNNKETKLYVEDEAVYYLWIYASDAVGNANLLKLDNKYYVDSKAPRITTEIIGNNEEYSNDVKIHVNIVDRNENSVDEESLSFEFYLLTYDENKFTKFNKDEGITYPYDYYGSYKLAIKACDDINNCKVYTSDESYLIDTAKIVMELIGDKEITILQYQKYKELGVVATKGNAGKNTVSVNYEIEGKVDIKTPGKYKIVYTAGSGISKVSIEREVIVKDSKYYLIGLVSLFVIGEIIIFARLFIKRRKNDNI